MQDYQLKHYQNVKNWFFHRQLFIFENQVFSCYYSYNRLFKTSNTWFSKIKKSHMKKYWSKNSVLKKSLLGRVGNWLFWTHFWIPCVIRLSKTKVWHLESQRDVFSTLRTYWLSLILLNEEKSSIWKKKTIDKKTGANC